MSEKTELTIQNLKDAYVTQQTIEANHKLYNQLNEANELLKELYTHLCEKGVRTTWQSIADANSWGKLLDKIEKRLKENDKRMDI